MPFYFLKGGFALSMLQATNREGKIITPSLLPKEAWSHLRKQSFFCPACKEPVILRAGEQTIPHFAHRPNSRCTLSVKGESFEHKQAKLLLYRWLQQQGLASLHLEKYLPSIQQRPDLLFSTKKNQVALEYQQVSVPAKEIRKRNAGYKRENIYPLWILGERLLQPLPKPSTNVYRLSFFERQFIRNYHLDGPSQLIYFCPRKERFTVLYDLILLSSQRAFVKYRQLPLSCANLTSLFPKQFLSSKVLFTLWYREKERFRTSPHPVRGKELQYRKWLYHKGVHVEQLPSLIHLPIRLQYIMNCPLWHWQTKLVLDLLHPLPIGSFLSIETCQSLLDPFVLPSFMSQLPDLIKEYMQYFIIFKFFAPVKSLGWKKLRSIPFFPYIEVSLKADRYLLRNLRQQGFVGEGEKKKLEC